MFKKILLGVAALSTAMIPQAAMADAYGQIQVENRSNYANLVDIIVTNTHGREYDALGYAGGYISPGYNRVLSFDDGEGHGHCWYTVTARFENGVTAQRSMDICNTNIWRIYDVDNTVH